MIIFLKYIILTVESNAKTNRDFNAAITGAMKESSACRKHVNLVVTTQQPTTTTEVESAAMNGNSGIA